MAVSKMLESAIVPILIYCLLLDNIIPGLRRQLLTEQANWKDDISDNQSSPWRQHLEHILVELLLLTPVQVVDRQRRDRGKVLQLLSASSK